MNFKVLLICTQRFNHICNQIWFLLQNDVESVLNLSTSTMLFNFYLKNLISTYANLVDVEVKKKKMSVAEFQGFKWFVVSLTLFKFIGKIINILFIPKLIHK